MQTTTGGGLQTLTSIIGGLMARVLDIRENRFVATAAELHYLIEPDRQLEPPLSPSCSLTVGYHVTLLYGLSVSDEIPIAEDMALVPFDQMRNFVNEAALSDVAPSIIKFNGWKSVSAIVKPFHWNPAFSPCGSGSHPGLDWGGPFFGDAQDFIELLALFHAGPVICLVTIPYCIHRIASCLPGQPYYHGSVGYGSVARSFGSMFTKSSPVNQHALNEAKKAFEGRKTERYKECSPAIARLAEVLARSGRFQADDKILDVAIALERMYELDGGEISFKLKTRAACFLGSGPDDRLRVFRDVRDFYEARSSIVHKRRKNSSPEAKAEAFDKGFAVARKSVAKLLQQGPPADWNEFVVRTDAERP